MLAGDGVLLSTCVFVFVAQSCPTLYYPMDCSPPGSPLSMEFSRQK